MLDSPGGLFDEYINICKCENNGDVSFITLK